MDISKNFTQTYNLLLEDKKIVLPALYSLVISIIIGLLFLSATGILPLMKDMVIQKAEYDKTAPLFAPNTDFTDYLIKNGYDTNQWLTLLNIKNLIITIVFAIIFTIISLYFSSLQLANVSISMTGKEYNLNTLDIYARKKIGNLIILQFVLGLLIFIPLVIMALLVFGSWFLNNILAILLGIVFIPSFLLYAIAISVFAVYGIPSMYIDSIKPIDSLKKSFYLVKTNFGYSLLMILIIGGISMLSGQVITNSLMTSLWQMLITSNIFVLIILSIVSIALIIIESIIMTFISAFLFYTYNDIKKENVKDGRSKNNGLSAKKH